MGQLIMCVGKKAAMPYYLESTSVNIFSLEEMSYYLIHKTEYVDGEFMCKEFCDWVFREAGAKDVAAKLLKCLEQNGTLHEFARVLMTETGYASREEISRTEELLAQFETKDELEQHKIRADRLLHRGRFTAAMEEYGWILEHQKEDTPEVFLGNIYHNLGTACGGIFLYEQAAEYFRCAYERNHNSESLKEELLSLMLSHQEEQLIKRASDCQVDKKVLEGLHAELESAWEQAGATSKVQHIEKMFQSFGDAVTKEEITECIQGWKQDYRAYGRSR